MFVSINDLNFFLNVMDIIRYLFYFINSDGLFFDSWNFLDLGVFDLNLNNFLDFDLHFFNGFVDNWDRDDFIDILFDDLIYFYKLRNNFFKLDNMWLLNDFFNNFFNFNYFWYFDNFFNNFFNNLLNWSLLLNSLFLRNNNLFCSGNLNNFLLHNIFFLMNNFCLDNFDHFINNFLNLLNLSIL